MKRGKIEKERREKKEEEEELKWSVATFHFAFPSKADISCETINEMYRCGISALVIMYAETKKLLYIYIHINDIVQSKYFLLI